VLQRELAITLLDRYVRYVTNGLLLIAGIGLTVLWILVTSEAILRWGFSKTMGFTSEISEFIFVGIALLGLAFVLRTEANIRIDLIFSHFPKEIKPWVQLVSDIIMVLVLAIYLISSVMFVLDSYNMRSISFFLSVRLWMPQLVLPIGFMLLFLEGLVKIFKRKTNS